MLPIQLNFILRSTLQKILFVDFDIVNDMDLAIYDIPHGSTGLQDVVAWL